jgi:hypothetical protein
MDDDKQVWLRILGVAVFIAVVLLCADLYALHVRNTQGTLKSSFSSPSTGQVSSTTPPQTSDTDSNGCFTSDTVREHEGVNGCVDFKVGYTYTSSKGNKFIDQYQNYTSGFAVYIPSTSAASGVNLSQFDNKNVKVSGYIQDYQGGPEIIVTDLSQIKI